MKLSKLWHAKTDDDVLDLAFSINGNLGVASGKCAYIFDPNGNLLNKVCSDNFMMSVSFCCERFGFIDNDSHVYITDQNGNLIKKLYVGNDYDSAITMVKSGFVACGAKCAFFGFGGKKKWELNVGGVENGPSYHDDYWYIADWDYGKLFIAENGKMTHELYYGEPVWDTAVCGDYLAISTCTRLFLYNISNPARPKEIWRVRGIDWARQVTFSPSCKFVAFADTYHRKLKIYDLKRKLVFEKEFDDKVLSIAWKKDKIAVGLGNGHVHIYNVEVNF